MSNELINAGIMHIILQEKQQQLVQLLA